MIDAVRSTNLARVLARHGRMSDLLPRLHASAIEAAGGRCSVLLQSNPRSSRLHPTSAFGLEYLTTSPWLTGDTESRLGALAISANVPTAALDLPMRYPELAQLLGTRHAVLLPLAVGDRPLGLVIVGLDTDPSLSDMHAALAPVADAFVLALERFHLQRDADLQRDVRLLLQEFSQRVSSTLTLRAGLESFCVGAARLFGADRASVWLHDRERREISLEASSDPASVAHAARVPAHDRTHPVVRAMRLDAAQISDASPGDPGDPPDAAVALRGRRRALGTLVLQGIRIEPGGEADVLARLEEAGRQLSSAIENTQLLEQVLDGRRELESRFNDTLTQKEKLAALGQFVAGIAHELNNPLQGVLGHLELLRTTGDLAPRLRKDVQMIYREADRAAKIVRNLLVFSGSRRLSRRRLSLNLVVSRVLALRAASCRAAAIDVARETDMALPRLLGDPLMLQQAVLHVLLNAEQAVSGRPGARIVVRTAYEGERGLAIASVSDNGPGVPADVLSRVFEPFFTTREVGKGAGLGLAIAYGIVQEHGGRIHAANGPAGGAVFTIELPVDSVK